MKRILAAGIILILVSCKKQNGSSPGQTNPPVVNKRCGIILSTPILDSFVYPTYYLTANVAFSGGNEIVHFHDDVTGNHDGSWFTSKYDKDSTYCTAIP